MEAPSLHDLKALINYIYLTIPIKREQHKPGSAVVPSGMDEELCIMVEGFYRALRVSAEDVKKASRSRDEMALRMYAFYKNWASLLVGDDSGLRRIPGGYDLLVDDVIALLEV